MKKSLPLYVLCMLSSSLFSAEQKASSGKSQTSTVPTKTQVTIKAIVLRDDSQPFNEKKYAHIKGVFLDGVDLCGDESCLKEYLHAPLDLLTINELKQKIIQLAKKNQDAMLSVVMPEQEASNGVVIYNVCKAKAGKVSYIGNRWVSTSFLESRTPSVKKGKCLDEMELLNDVAWLNRNPFHHTKVILSKGQGSNTSDVEFITEDRFPVRFFVGCDNTGTEFTDTVRLYAGANWGNAFWVGDTLSYQYTASPGFHRFQSQFLNYTSYLPWKHILSVYGALSWIHPSMTDFATKGKNNQASLRYVIPFKPLFKPFLHEFTFGFDYKNFNNNLFFVESLSALPLITQTVNITQFYLGYSLQNKTPNIQYVFKIDVLGSPANWIANQSKADYGDLRPHSQAQYLYSIAHLGFTHKQRSEFTISGLLRAQIATGPLLPSEQIGLGGYDTVRGYEERAYLADNGVCANLELHSPSCHFFSDKMRDEFFGLVFLDFGWGRDDRTSSTGLPKSDVLAGIGPGLRYNIYPYLSARLDYGFQLHHIFDDHHFGKFHFGVTASY